MAKGAIHLSGLSFLGENQEPAFIDFDAGANVICGASDTGKSFVLETLDFMLGGTKPPRDLPERQGYESIVLGVNSANTSNCLERAVSGGGFRLFSSTLDKYQGVEPVDMLKAKHKANSEDNISGWLLARCGLLGKQIRSNEKGNTRSLSFRDLARLVVVQEQEIIKRESPFLSGQYISATAEKSVLKLLLSGVDDSALVEEVVNDREHEHRVIKASLVDEWIYDLRNEIDRSNSDRQLLEKKLEDLEESIENERSLVAESQSIFDKAVEKRGEISRNKSIVKARLDEIDELLFRFHLLNDHYDVDLKRLASIKESGVLFVHEASVACPLCGAEPAQQHLEGDCDGNIDQVVDAADAEIKKILKLKGELKETVHSLKIEKASLGARLANLESNYSEVVKQIKIVESPKLGQARMIFSGLLEDRDHVRRSLSIFRRLDELEKQKESLLGDRRGSREKPEVQTGLSKSALQEFSTKVESILNSWGFPDMGPVYFDESAMDFVINGKPRGSRGKGLRAITHAAITLGLMDYCLEKRIPHPGFVAIDSPLLSYYEPEGEEDNLQGTDLKERFYSYVSSDERRGQVIVIDNEHPPGSFDTNINVTVFSKNPDLDRYGFFPIAG